MDDSSLKVLSLSVKGVDVPLKPAFQKNIKKYTCVVDSSAEGQQVDLGISVKAVCTEPDGFCQVQKTTSNGTVSLKEGVTEIDIKVDAPDSSCSHYIIEAYKPSGNSFDDRFGYQFS